MRMIAPYLFVLLQEAFNTHQRLFQFIICSAVGAAHIADAGCTEGTAGDNGDLFLEEQLFGKLFIGHTGIADVREGIEGPMRLTAGEADAIEAIHKHAATAVVSIMHHLYRCPGSSVGSVAQWRERRTNDA